MPASIAPSLARWNGRLGVIAQWLLAAAVIGFAGRELARQWRDLGPALAGLDPSWAMVLGSGAIVVVAYLILIEAWRATLRVWSEPLPFTVAARIWFVSNLGKYVPGKVWQIAAMGTMAQHARVSAATAVASSLLVNVVNIVAGFAVIAVTATGQIATAVGTADGRAARTAEVAVVAISVAGGAALALAPFAIPRLAALAGRVSGRSIVVPGVPHRAVWTVAAATTGAWLLYGISFAAFAHAVTPRATGTVASYIAVYTGSYLAGYLALFAPGGVGVREAVLVLAMPRFGLMSAPDAAIVAIASRLWLTVLEIVPGLALWIRRPRSELDRPT